jgi:Fe-S cluster biogenesis protein NfuA
VTPGEGQPSRSVVETVTATIRPRLRAHGGDLTVHVDEHGIAEVSFHGACRGCPALPMTYVAAVRTPLREAGATDVTCDQVNVSDHAASRLAALWPTAKETPR